MESLPVIPPISPEIYRDLVKQLGFPNCRDPGEAILQRLVELSTEYLPQHKMGEKWALLVMLLSLAETGGGLNLNRALMAAVVLDDVQAFRLVRDVVAVRRDADAILAVNACKFVRDQPHARLDVTPWVPRSRPFPCSPEALDFALEKRGATRIHVLKRSSREHPYDRTVALAVTREGDVELLKETMSEAEGPLGIEEIEHATWMGLEFSGHTMGTGRFIGFDAVPPPAQGPHFMRRSFSFGRVLSETHWFSVPVATALSVVQRIARNLYEIHRRGYMVLDLRPQNVLEDGTIFDLSHARSTIRGEGVETFLMEADYAAPEVVLRRHASRASDIFSLGVILHSMITGQHAFARGGSGSPDPIDSAVPNAILEYDPKDIKDEKVADLLRWMLAKDSVDRPTAKELLEWFETYQDLLANPVVLRSVPKENTAPLALVPMRAGYPHNGHVNLICRLMDMGFRVLVSLQMAYTWTDRDPVPKWIVAKMLRLALEERGYSAEDMSVVLTPFEDLRTQHMHFLMLPQWDKVSLIVSGNPEVHGLLDPIREDRPLIRSQALCGDLTDANGTIVRTAWEKGDKETVNRMSSPVVRAMWPNTVKDFFPKVGDTMVAKPMKVSVQVLDGDNEDEVVHTVLVRRYEFPEQAICRRLKGDPSSLNVLAVTPVIRLPDKSGVGLQYIRQEFDLEAETLLITFRMSTT